MKKSRLSLLAAGTLLIPTVLLIACGDDDAVLLSVQSEAGSDANNHDSSAPNNRDDGAVSTPDTGTGPTDSGTDADGGVLVGEPDSGLQAKDFQARVAQEVCRYTARCCFGKADLDAGTPVEGGTWQAEKCISTYQTGFENSSPGDSADPAYLTLNKASADDCIGLLQTADCTQTSAEFQAIRKACYDATLGTQKAGDPCKTTPECQPGNFCNTTLDGGADSGAGVCETVRTTGSKCGDWTTNAAAGQSTCSYRFSGDPAGYCDFFDYVGGKVRTPDQWICKTTLPNGEKCASGEWCASGLCAYPSSVCVPSTNPFNSVACGFFATP